MHFDRKYLSDRELIELYRAMLFPRLLEEKMLLLLRQGRISKWFSGIGQEAIAAGVAKAMKPEDWIMPLHRNLGVFTGRGMPTERLFRQWQGDADGYSNGRERSFHFGSREHYICGMISHLGPQLAVATGVALAHKLRGENRVALAFTGEGGTSEGDFHEALNLAAVWDLPVIFLVENNGYGLSTPVTEQFRCARISDKGTGYGIESIQIDGNNILTVLDTISGVRNYCQHHQKPYLVECMTFRMRGHEEASGTKYVPAGLFEKWAKKDPVGTFELFLLEKGILDAGSISTLREKMRSEIAEAVSQTSRWPEANPSREIAAVYSGFSAATPEAATDPQNVPAETASKTNPESARAVLTEPPAARSLKFFEAIREGLRQSMESDPELILMGQDIAGYGGAFKITEGLLNDFGAARVRNTPLCESAVIGAALGLGLEGISSVVEMQFADFVSVGFNQVVNNLAKIRYRWGQDARVVIRMPTGAGIGAGPFHSQSNEAWFTHVPGLKVVYPSTPEDAKGLLMAAIRDPDPVLFFEHKAMYRSISGPVPATGFSTPIGKARLVQEGEDFVIVTYGLGVIWAASFSKRRPDLSIMILDLRSLQPIDWPAVRGAVEKTGKALVLHEDTLTGGLGGEIAAWIGEHCFEQLDAPVIRCASLDTPVPFNATLEKSFLAESRLEECVNRLVYY